MASALAGYDIGLANLHPSAFTGITMDGDEYVRCNKCGYGGCDVRISGCGCTLHSVSDYRSSRTNSTPRAEWEEL